MDEVIVLSDSEESVGATGDFVALNDDNFEFPEVNFHYDNNKKETYSDSAYGSCETNENFNYFSKQNSELTSEDSQNTEINIVKNSKSKKKNNSSEKKAERERKKEEMARQKAQKKVESKNLKSMKPEECMKFMRITIDGNLQTQPYFLELISSLQKLELNFKVDSELIPFSISWRRETVEHYLNCLNEMCSRKTLKDENHLLIIWSCKDVLEKIADSTFIGTIASIVDMTPGKRITLFIYGMRSYFSYQKNLNNNNNRAGVIEELGRDEPLRRQNKKDKMYGSAPTVSRHDLEVNLCELQLLYNCSSRLIDSQEELNLAVFQFTKAIAETPYKLEKYKNMDIVTDTRGAVAVGNDGVGLKRLWQQQLCQFDSISLEIADAICGVYKSPLQLMDAYSKCTPTEGEMLLKDIPIRRAAGPVTTSRKLGAGISKRIYMMFTTEDGDILIDNDNDKKK